MLNTKLFINALVEANYTDLYCVPCSFAANLIDAILDDGRIKYHASSSEGLACSQAAGQVMAGGKPFVIMQSTGIGNSVSVMTSLMIPYGIHFPIITSKRTWKEGDPEIQHAVLASKLEELIEATDFFAGNIDANGTVGDLIKKMESCNKEHRVLVLHKDTFSKVETTPRPEKVSYQLQERIEFMKAFEDEFGGNEDYIFIGTTGGTSREMNTWMPTCRNFLMAGSMGHVLAIATGIAQHYQNIKKRVKIVVLDGDAAFCMHTGAVFSAANEARNFEYAQIIHLIFDNGSNATTGGQPSPFRPGYGHFMAKNIYQDSTIVMENPDFAYETISDVIEEIKATDLGISMMEIQCKSTTGLPPRPTVEGLVNSKLHLKA